MASRYLYIVEAKPRVKVNAPISWVTYHTSEKDAKRRGESWDLERFRVSMYRYIKTAWPNGPAAIGGDHG